MNEAKYEPKDIDTTLCTHIIYEHAILDPTTLTLKSDDPVLDIDAGFYKSMTKLKEKGVPVLLSLQSKTNWNINSRKNAKYSYLVRNEVARNKFVSHTVEYLRTHNFDGLHIQYSHPVCYQNICSGGHPDEKHGYTHLIRMLSAAFKPYNLLLSVGVSPLEHVIRNGYDVREISK